MKSTTTTALIAAGALLVGGAATAAFMSHRTAPANGIEGATAMDEAALQDGRSDALPASQLSYADIVKVDPVTEKAKLYATVIGTEPVREVTTTTTPREVCNDVVVQERLPERDGNVGGTVAGALIGGLVGNQFGSGNGRKAATAAGAAAGGFVGNRVDRNHVGGRVVNRTERQCHTENTASESSRVTGYNVTYRNEDGTTGTMRMSDKPGNRIAMGNTDKVLGYDVTYRLEGEDRTIRMDDKPQSDRLPVIDGKVVVQADDATVRS
jgi:uncharacterized protein YcfJ